MVFQLAKKKVPRRVLRLKSFYLNLEIYARSLALYPLKDVARGCEMKHPLTTRYINKKLYSDFRNGEHLFKTLKSNPRISEQCLIPPFHWMIKIKLNMYRESFKLLFYYAVYAGKQILNLCYWQVMKLITIMWNDQIERVFTLINCEVNFTGQIDY